MTEHRYKNLQQMLATEFKSTAIHHDQVGVIFGWQDGSVACNSIYMMHHFSRMKDKKHAIIFKDAESFDKFNVLYAYKSLTN